MTSPLPSSQQSTAEGAPVCRQAGRAGVTGWDGPRRRVVPMPKRGGAMHSRAEGRAAASLGSAISWLP
jgi:hypothetical protein